MTDSLTTALPARAAALVAEFDRELAAVEASRSSERVEELRLAYLGRKGKVTALLEDLRGCTKEERPAAGRAINELKQHVEAAITALKGKAQEWELGARLHAEPLDISLPVTASVPRGSLHPVTLIRRELLTEFRRLGFTVYDGPEIDYDFYNFSALNMPSDHPARDMQDTFYVREQEHLLLRTHTSNIQIHCMLTERPPLRVVAPGRVFRVDSDPTHTPMFHQIEAFVVDRGVTFAHMKGVIDAFMKAVFGSSMKTRLRPSFFPFVEPGAELDLQCVHCQGKGCRLCKHTGWLEVGGCGMIHPNVFEAVEYDSEIYSGFAFGFGIDRMAMLKYKLDDLRQLFEGSHSFLGHFPLFT
ncbi:MAG: phenylalanine--tRNA ligase subunit alpha [Deltaproteobacteria bacterium]|nr:phenylalanine--tRNA ligase subunit alpha [Deltaproteobacteria bacterium]